MCFVTFQKCSEKSWRKKSGCNYGAVENKKRGHFIDGLNIPEVDRYGTVQPHALLWQHIDYGHWWAFTSYLMLCFNFCIVVHVEIHKPYRNRNLQDEFLNLSLEVPNSFRKEKQKVKGVVESLGRKVSFSCSWWSCWMLTLLLELMRAGCLRCWNWFPEL